METIEDLAEELCEHCPATDYGTEIINTSPHNMCEGSWCTRAYENYKDNLEEEIMNHKRVIFNKPATIVIWEDDTKTVVKCNPNDKFKKKVGFLMAYYQKNSGLTKHQCSKTLKALVKES